MRRRGCRRLAGQVSEGALVSEYEESAGQDQTVPGQTSKGPDQEPPRSRRAGASKAAGTVAGALTSRTAGWMVAAALAGSLVTLGVDHSTAQPTAGSVTIRNAGRVAAAPSGSTRHRQIPAMTLTPKRFYVGPGDPLAVGGLAGGQGGTSWVMQPACAVPGPGGPPFSKSQRRIITIPMPKRVVIGRPGHQKLPLHAGQIPALKRIRFARPACPILPIHCRAGMRIAIGQAPAATRVHIEQRGRVFVIGPGQQPPRRVSVSLPDVVVVPSFRFIGSGGPQCVTFWAGQR